MKDLLEFILTRQMVSKVGPLAPTRAEIEDLLKAAMRAPNHHLTEPWRFIVLKGPALAELGEAMTNRVKRKYADDPQLDHKVELERSRTRRAPVIIVVVFSPRSNHPLALEAEDRYAMGAAVENMLLTAHAKGLGAYWRTGPAATDDDVKHHLGLVDEEEIASFLYIGYPEGELPPRSKRSDFRERTEWRGFSEGD